MVAILIKASSGVFDEISKNATSMQVLHSLQMPHPQGAMHALAPVQGTVVPAKSDGDVILCLVKH